MSRSVQRKIGEVELRLIETEIDVKIIQHSSKVLYPACTIREGGDQAADDYNSVNMSLPGDMNSENNQELIAQ